MHRAHKKNKGDNDTQTKGCDADSCSAFTVPSQGAETVQMEYNQIDSQRAPELWISSTPVSTASATALSTVGTTSPRLEDEVYNTHFSNSHSSDIIKGKEAPPQRVRLTTVNPLTEDIGDINSTVNAHVDFQSSVYSSCGELDRLGLDPALIEQVESPNLSELSIDSSISYLDSCRNSDYLSGEERNLDIGKRSNCSVFKETSVAKTVSEDFSVHSGRTADDNIYSTSDRTSTAVINNNRTSYGCEATYTGSRNNSPLFMTGQQRLNNGSNQRNIKKHLQETEIQVNSSTNSLPDSVAKSHIPARSSRRTMGVGGSGTSTLGLSYSNATIFPIKNRPGIQQKPTNKQGSSVESPAADKRKPIPKSRTVKATADLASGSSKKEAPSSTQAKIARAKTITLSPNRRLDTRSSAGSLSKERGKSTVRRTNTQAASSAARSTLSKVGKAKTMSRSTASNFLNPNLRRRSKSGVFESHSSSSSPGSTEAATPKLRGAGGIGPSTTIGPGATERQHLRRPVHARLGSNPNDEDSSNPCSAGIPATSAAAGAAGRPRRMTQQATKLSINTAWTNSTNAARRTVGNNGGTNLGSVNTSTPTTTTLPKSKIAAGVKTSLTNSSRSISTSEQRYLHTPLNHEHRLVKGNESGSSEKETNSSDSARKTNIAIRQTASDKSSLGRVRDNNNSNSGAGHRPLQAKLETASSASYSDPSAQSGGSKEMRQRTRTIPLSSAAGRSGRSAVGTPGSRVPSLKTQKSESGRDNKPKAGTQTHRTFTSETVPSSSNSPAASSNHSHAVPYGKYGNASTNSTDDRNEKDTNANNTRNTHKSQAIKEGNSTRDMSLPSSAPRNANALSSSVSAIGIGSYGMSQQTAKPPIRAGVAGSVIGTSSHTASGSLQYSQAPPVPIQTHPLVGQASHPQMVNPQRFTGIKGPSSVVSAPSIPPAQQMAHIHFPAPKPIDQQSAVSSVSGGHHQMPSSSAMPSAQYLQQQPAHNRTQSVVQPANSRNSQSSDRVQGGAPVMTPHEAIARYGQQLTAHERGEILEYPHVYYVGNAKGRGSMRQNYVFDDERGDYIVHLHDHMLYRYELMDVLGKGSFGQVLRAKDHKTGDIVAIKIIRNRKRFHHQAQVEVKLLECLRRWDPNGSHNILQITASFYFRNHLCIVMELLSINLYEWLKAHQFAGTPLSLLRSFTVQMLQSLQLMARHRIIHADLKPENVLLVHPPPMPARRAAPPGVGAPPPHPLNNPQLSMDMQRGTYAIKVIDLGSSCFENERVYTYIQSRFYRAPEVILGLSYGPGIDMWSLGCIVAELLTGYPLFPGENEREQLACIIEVLGPPPAYMLERAPRCADFAEPSPYPVAAAPAGNMMLLPNGACVVGSVTIKPYTNSKGKRRRPGSRPLSQVLARARDPRLVDFVMRALAWDPAMRMSPEDALHHIWTTDMPMQRHVGLAVPPSVHLSGVQPGYGMAPPVSYQQHQHQQMPPSVMQPAGTRPVGNQGLPGGYAQRPQGYGMARPRKA